MIEILRNQNETLNTNRTSQTEYEVTRFMENYFEAVHGGNAEEVNTYYANGMRPITLPIYAEPSQEAIVFDDYLATYSCQLKGSRIRLAFLLDKAEGYWQIIQGEILGVNTHH